MKVGLSIFATDSSISPLTLGPAAEDRGFESLWFPEHSHIPVSRATPFLGRGDAEPLPEKYWRTHDQIVGLTAVAAATHRLRVCTGVCLVAQHDPIWLAKSLASLDLISEGRLTIGIGYGWNREEMAHHGIEYGKRRDILREKVLAIKALWIQEEAKFSGNFVNFSSSWAWPKPLQTPHPPIILGGGLGPKNIAHLLEFCDGWMPSYRFNDVLRGIEVLRREAERAGRDPDSLDVTVNGAPSDEPSLMKLMKAGVDRVVFMLPSGDEREVLMHMDRYARLLKRLSA